METTWRRRSVLAAVAAGPAALAGCAGPAGRADSAGWPLWRRDPGRTGYTPDAAGPDRGHVRWRLDAGAGAVTPVTRDGVVFVTGDAVRSLAAEDGSERWSRPLYYDTRTPAAVHRGAVYVTSKFGFYAIDARSGSDRWFDNEGGRRFHAPVAVDDTLYLAATEVGDPRFRASVVARSVDDGTVRWRQPVGGGVLPPFAIAVGESRLFVGRDAVYALDARDGSNAWTARPPGISAFGDPAVADGTVYVPGTRPAEAGGLPEGVVLALDAADGTERWRVGTGLSPSPPAVGDGIVYVAADRVYAIGADDGDVRWRAASHRYVTASPAVTRGSVYVAGVGGDVLALDRADGSTVWWLQTDASMLSSPAVIDRSVIVKGAGGRTIAIGE